MDDARGHIATVKMLRSFHYTDEKGKDQGINGEFMLVNQTVVDLSSLTPYGIAVRNRAKEIVELLSDVEKIRMERRKAKANRNKYGGTGSDGMGSGFSGGSGFGGSGSRYGGFGSDSMPAYGGSSDRRFNRHNDVDSEGEHCMFHQFQPIS